MRGYIAQVRRIVSFNGTEHRTDTPIVCGEGSAKLNGAVDIFCVASDNAVDVERAADMRCRLTGKSADGAGGWQETGRRGFRLLGRSFARSVALLKTTPFSPPGRDAAVAGFLSRSSRRAILRRNVRESATGLARPVRQE